MTQNYINIEDTALETVFLFPLDIPSVVTKIVCDFQLPNGNHSIFETKIEDKETAQTKHENKFGTEKSQILDNLSRI